MESTPDILEDQLSSNIHPYFQHTHATTGQRFLNFFIDNLIMKLVLTYATAYALGYLLAMVFPEVMDNIVNNQTELLLLSYLIVIVNYLIYYTLCEKLFKGVTLGKLITGTRAIRTDGDDLTFKDALLRSLSRMVPFEIFSGFGVPWHDSWTDTMVVKTR